MCWSPDPIKVNTSLQNLMRKFQEFSETPTGSKDMILSTKASYAAFERRQSIQTVPFPRHVLKHREFPLLRLKICPGCSQRPEPKDILDVGCSTGLSTLKLVQTFPKARRIIAADLSPHMLSVAKYNLRTRESQSPARGVVEYIHAAGENTGLAEGSMDLVSICLIGHELPAEATRCALFARLVLCDCSRFFFCASD